MCIPIAMIGGETMIQTHDRCTGRTGQFRIHYELAGVDTLASINSLDCHLQIPPLLLHA